MSNWTNEHDILRDLSLAQGSEVPVEDVNATPAGQRPQPIVVTEETEQEYYPDYIEEEEQKAGPDYALIQQMLTVVQHDEVNLDSIDEDDGTQIQITKSKYHGYSPKGKRHIRIMPKTPEKTKTFENPKPLDIPMLTYKSKSPVKYKKRRENVAVSSILRGIKNSQTSSEDDQGNSLKLLKPAYFIGNKPKHDENSSSKRSADSLATLLAYEKLESWFVTQEPSDGSEKEESVRKVNNWLDSQIIEKPCQPSVSTWNSGLVYRKKGEAAVKSIEDESVISSETTSNENKGPKMFQPSSYADEYYQTFVERSKMNEIANEGIWAKAERLMKEIEEKKKKKTLKQLGIVQETSFTDMRTDRSVDDFTETSADNQTDASAEITESSSNNVPNYDYVLLTRHRHLLVADCVVCEVAKKNHYNIDTDVSNEIHVLSENVQKFLKIAQESINK